MKAVFDVKPGSEYDDEITSRYHFPARRNYIEAARAAVGDWALFREPRRGGGRLAYVATARVTEVAPDAARSDHLYAYVSDFLAFPTPAPFAIGGRYAEAPLRAAGQVDPADLRSGLCRHRARRPLRDPGAGERRPSRRRLRRRRPAAPERARIRGSYGAAHRGPAGQPQGARRRLPPGGVPRLPGSLRRHRPLASSMAAAAPRRRRRTSSRSPPAARTSCRTASPSRPPSTGCSIAT